MQTCRFAGATPVRPLTPHCGRHTRPTANGPWTTWTPISLPGLLHGQSRPGSGPGNACARSGRSSPGPSPLTPAMRVLMPGGGIPLLVPGEGVRHRGRTPASQGRPTPGQGRHPARLRPLQRVLRRRRPGRSGRHRPLHGRLRHLERLPRRGREGAKATTGGVSLLARQMEHSCSRRWTASNSRRAKACLKPPECISWRVVARNLAISCQSFWRASGMGTSRAA